MFKVALSSPTQSDLYHYIPVAYMWDDHDYGPNNSDKTSPGREAALLSYRENVPSYPLNSTGPVSYAFTIGNVRFIVPDERSDKDPPGSDGSNLGPITKAWFKDQLLQAKESGVAAIFWVSTYSWICGSDEADAWGGAPTERTELSDFIKGHDIKNLYTISGDAHMLAFDDGRNNNFDTAHTFGWPVFQAASLEQISSSKGGPYSHGCATDTGQFGIITVTQNNNQTCVRFGAHHMDAEIWAYDTCNPTQSSLGECINSKAVAQFAAMHSTEISLWAIGSFFLIVGIIFVIVNRDIFKGFKFFRFRRNSPEFVKLESL